MIRVKNLTKDFGHRKGIFDLSFEIQNGEVFGYLGPGGAGKTTTIRQLLGFAYPTRGRCFVNGKNCHIKQEEIRGFTGYLPEDSLLPDNMTGLGFLQFMAHMKGIHSIELALQLAERFEYSPEIRIRKMSKETKRKLGIICAFMHDPSVLMLDEPMKDIDPMMQNRLVDLIMEEKRRGKTILISSSTLDEVERVCDRIGMIRNGILIHVDDISGIRSSMKKSYIITFESEQDAQRFTKEDFMVQSIYGCQVTISLTGNMQPLVKVLGDYPVTGLKTKTQSLGELFSHFYGGDRNA